MAFDGIEEDLINLPRRRAYATPTAMEYRILLSEWVQFVTFCWRNWLLGTKQFHAVETLDM